MADVNEKDREAARAALGGCVGDSCRERPAFNVDTGQPTGETFFQHSQDCPLDNLDAVAELHSKARAEGRLEGLREARDILCSRAPMSDGFKALLARIAELEAGR